jgi:hypothetical protein
MDVSTIKIPFLDVSVRFLMLTCMLVLPYASLRADARFALNCPKAIVETEEDILFDGPSPFRGKELDEFRASISSDLERQGCYEQSVGSACKANNRWTLRDGSELTQTWCSSGAYLRFSLWYISDKHGDRLITFAHPSYKYDFADSDWEKPVGITFEGESHFARIAEGESPDAFDPESQTITTTESCCNGDVVTTVKWQIRNGKPYLVFLAEEVANDGKSIFHEGILPNIQIRLFEEKFVSN